MPSRVRVMIRPKPIGDLVRELSWGDYDLEGVKRELNPTAVFLGVLPYTDDN